MIRTGFLLTFLLSSCWAANENNSDQVPLLTSYQGGGNDEIPFLTSQGEGNDEIPFLTSSQGNANADASQNDSAGQKVSNLLLGINELPPAPPAVNAQSPDNRGRSDIEIEHDQPSRGYFYPKPSKEFRLPEFKTLDSTVPVQADAGFAEEGAEVQRQPRSPQRRLPYFPGDRRPPPFIPGFIPPHNIRPLPALYGRY